MAEHDDELLAAYLDGVGELTPEERMRVEAHLGELDVAGIRGTLDQLRALPAERREPDWRALEKRIAAAVDTGLNRASWWRRWFVPAGALVMAAGSLLLWLRHVPGGEPTQPAPVAAVGHPAVVDDAVPMPAAQPTELWLDGQLVDVSDADPDALLDNVDTSDALAAEDDGLLPTLRWVDNLDDRSIERAEHLLEKKKS